MYWSVLNHRDMAKLWKCLCHALSYFLKTNTLASILSNSMKSIYKINPKLKKLTTHLTSKIMYEFLHKTQERFQKNKNDSGFVVSPKFYK